MTGPNGPAPPSRGLAGWRLNVLRLALAAFVGVAVLAADLSAGKWLLLWFAIVVVILVAIEVVRARPRRHHRLLIPQQLPPQIGSILGREAGLDTIVAALTKTRRTRTAVILIHGPAGLGKTALAIAAAQRVARHYPHGQLYELLEGRSVRDVQSHIILALRDITDIESPERTRALRDIAKRRFLMILDDAHTAEEVLPLLPNSRRSAVIVTAQEPIEGLPDHTVVVPLGLLDPGETRALMNRYVGPVRLGTEPEPATPTRSQPDRAASILQITGGLPLAITLTGAALAARPDWSLAMVEQRIRELPALGPGADHRLDVCYALMSTEERAAGRMLGMLPGSDFAPWHIQALLEVSENDAWAIVDRLAHRGLVERVTEDAAGVRIFRALEHVRGYARGRLAAEVDPADRAAAGLRLTAKHDERRAYDLAQRLRHTVYAPLEKGDLVAALTNARDVLSLANDAQRLWAQDTTEHVQARRDLGLALAALSEMHCELGSVDEAWDFAVAALSTGSADVVPRARRCMGTLQLMVAAAHDSRASLLVAHAEALAAADEAEQIRVLRRLAIAEASCELFEAADAHLEQARDLCAERTDGGTRLLVGLWWAEAVVRIKRGRPRDLEEANALLRTADRAADLENLPLWRAWIHFQRAQVAFLKHNYTKAYWLALISVDRFGALRHRYGTAHGRLIAGRALVRMGLAGSRGQAAAYADAIAQLEEALSTFAACGDLAANARAEIALAEAKQLLGTRVIRGSDGRRMRHEARTNLRIAATGFAAVGDQAGRAQARSLLWRLRLAYPYHHADVPAWSLAVGPGQ